MHIFYSKFYQCEDLKVIFTSFFSPRKPFSGFTLVYTPNVWHHSLWHGTIGNISVICYCGTIGQPLQCSCTPLQLDMKSLLIKRWVESQTVETLLYSLGFKTFSQNLSIFTIVKFSMAFKGHSSNLVLLFELSLWLWQQFDRLETSIQTRVLRQSSLHLVTVRAVDFAVRTVDFAVWMVDFVFGHTVLPKDKVDILRIA